MNQINAENNLYTADIQLLSLPISGLYFIAAFLTVLQDERFCWPVHVLSV